MNDILKGEGIRRTHIKTRLMRESLVDKQVLASNAPQRAVSLLPDASIVGIGGHSIMDRGRGAVLPMCDAIVRTRAEHKLIIGVSGGTRARHTLSVGLDLGLPTGGLAQILGAVEEQNGALLQALLSAHGGVFMPRDSFSELALYLNLGVIPIIICMPPFHYWEEPPPKGQREPINGPDVGLYLTAEVLGVRQLIFVKDVDGFYTDDPATNPDAELIREATAQELLDARLPSYLIEPKVLELMQNGCQVREFQIINGLHAGNLDRALAGEHVGTIVRA